ncbi:hypothetical protein HYH03_017193 [Edaphochlamys debaryana]|uniref:Iron-binding zinc finger CDGSH type domain-containing protein n=1 Tax=Edaphochlamys debaryana TaxID=47281 RepID=A0A835XG33_9CHLO|nr:hypothetical protein HYH03_017190 [Edaphochlamys debaryana]KAG2483947.1 hypothetical protein HYH03_017193 [Edaphochlamys debaryana]|eukprot:KAG2483944.1 hypothetical protein HYH03_017190 [Edaphochlamys debaryana]
MAVALRQSCAVASVPTSRRVAVVVRASAGQINPSIRKSEEKVADIIKVANVPKPKAVFCRCWRADASKFPYCDGSHVKHNKETGDNVGPLVIDSTP